MLAELAIQAPDEIDVALIAAHLGAVPLVRAPANQEGHVVARGAAAVIALSEASCRSPKWRFVVAHELGHVLLHRGIDRLEGCTAGEPLRASSPEALRVAEKEANDFATAMLMPRGLFVRFRDRRALCIEAVRAVARAFATSLTATALRWVQLAEEPCAVVYAERERIAWWATTPAFGVRLRPRQRIAEATRAGELARGEGADGDAPAKLVAAALWSADGTKAEGDVLEESVRLEGFGGVLTLLQRAT